MLRAFQWDLARQVERLDWLLAQLPRYADWGYNELYLHLEDAVAYPSFPEIARRDAYSYREMETLVAAAQRVGIAVVPIVNLLGHTQYLIKTPRLRDLNELRAPDGSPLARGQICPVHPRTLQVADRLLRDVRPFCTAGKVHVGLDESFHLGKHPLSREEIARIGLPAHFAQYVTRLRELTRAQGLQMGMWADMLYFLPAAIPLLPRDVAAYEWYYYGFKRRPRVELHNFAESDVGERLVARGIEYWGCPMNGAFRFEPLPHFSDRLENILSWWQRCHRLNAAGMLITSWEPNRLAMELTTVIDAAAASLWLDGVDDPRRMLERGFARAFGPRGTPVRDASSRAPTIANVDSPRRRGVEVPPWARASARVALHCDRYPFAGYPRWEINTRWDVLSRREAIAPFRAEERHFRRLATTTDAAGIPDPLRASIALRWYLAARDVWVRSAQTKIRERQDPAARRAAVAEFRSSLRRGLQAARQLWRRTRDPKQRGPNEDILLADEARAAAFAGGADVFGPRWQLCYRVDNFAPAAQLVTVEQQRDHRAWEVKQACHTIEFQSAAAKRRNGFVRAHAAPVDWDGDRRRFPRLRFTLRGVGQVRLADVQLTDGRTSHRPTWKTKILGRAAPHRGFPDLDWTADRAAANVTFAPAP